MPKKIKASCTPVNKRSQDLFLWQIKSKVQFECQNECPHAHKMDKGAVKFIERSFDPVTNSSNTGLLVTFQYPSKTQSQGWSIVLKFTQ